MKIFARIEVFARISAPAAARGLEHEAEHWLRTDRVANSLVAERIIDNQLITMKYFNK